MSLYIDGIRYSGSGNRGLSGTAAPSDSKGANGDTYMQYSGGDIIAVFGKIGGHWYQYPTGGGGSSFHEMTISEGVRSTSTETITVEET